MKKSRAERKREKKEEKREKREKREQERAQFASFWKENREENCEDSDRPKAIDRINAFDCPGKKLSDTTSQAPEEDARMAAADAALARIGLQQHPTVHIRYQVKRELEAEAAGDEKDKTAEEVPVGEVSSLSLRFTCPLTGATLTKSDRESRLKEAILKRFEQDPVEASVMMMHTFNRDRDRVKAAVDVISKYVDNVCKQPAEEKYRSIKVSNKVFQEKVHCVEGSREFLQALGFQSTRVPAEGEGEDEEFLVLPEQSADALELMAERRDRLRRGEPLTARLDRRAQAFRASLNADRFELPPEFVNLTAEELAREQQQMSELVEKIGAFTMRRTKAMREKQEQRARRRYNYAVLRIRLPDGILLQGTFYAWDRMPVLFSFVRESLVDGWQPFELFALGARKLQESEEVTLAECNLVPTALLTFKWNPGVQVDVIGTTGKSPALLKPQLLDNIQTLD